jgi:hypothetical protein
VAQGAHRLEIVLVSRCREAKATKYYGLGMPWLSMCYDANDKVGIKTRTLELMAKFGITPILALVLLDERGRVICADGCRRCGADPEGLSFPWREQPNRGPGTRAVVNFDLPARVWAQQPGSPMPPAGSTAATGAPGGPGEQTERPVSPERIRPASRPPSKNFGRKRDPVSAVNTPGERTKRLVSPARIQPASRPPSENFARKRDPVSTVDTAGGIGSRGGRVAGCPMPPARSTAATGALGGLPPSFLSSRTDETRGDQAVEVANVHARASNRRAQRKVEVPGIVAADRPPDKPNLPLDRQAVRFAPESIQQGELTSLMQPQLMAEVHPFAPTLRK